MASYSKRAEIKIEEVCRTCLSKDNVLYSIFDIFDGTITVDYIVNSVTGLKINKNDGLPHAICWDCKEKAANAFDFKKKSEEAHMLLQGILKNENSRWSALTKSANILGVKTEDKQIQDNIDYTESDYNISLTSGQDFNELDNVKSEDEIDSKKPFNKNNNCLETFSIENGGKLQKKKCIKIEFEESNSSYCPLCVKCFDDSESLTKHMWKHHADIMGPKGRGRPKKLLTSTILTKLSERGLHITSSNNMECLFCKRFFKTKEELGAHLMSHKDMKILCCVLCRKNYLEKLKFDQHRCMSENELSNALVSEKKSLSFLSETTLQDLIPSDSEMENITILQICTACSCVFLSEKDLIDHHDAEHPELSLRCNLCTKVFATVKGAERHRKMCKEVEKNYTCKYCGLKFAYQITLNKHILRYHEGESVFVKFIDSKTKCEDRQYQCDTCNRCFYKRELLVKHTKIHMPNEKLFECDVCLKRFHRSDNLRSHKRIHEVGRDKTPSRTLLCLYCGRSFSNSSNLIVHMRRHTGEKPYKCDFCDKGFPRSSDLQCHRRTHTGEKPCICRVCGKGFSRSNKLTRHMRVHTGQRPYKCSYCEKAFSQSNDLTLHIRRHTGDRPYICEVCGDRFIQGTALQNHRRAHGHFPPQSTATVNVQSLAFKT